MQVFHSTRCNARLRPTKAALAYRALPDQGDAVPRTGGCAQLGTCGRG